MLFWKILFTSFLVKQCLAEQGDYQSMPCPSHITKFAGKPLTGEYFECERVGEAPVRKSCPADEIYHAADQECLPKHHHRERRQAVEILEELTLGRHVSLGDLYNARTNKIWTGTSFWSPATIKSNQHRSNVPNTKTTFFVARTSYERMAHMDINAELKLSFMSGLISVEGSAAYLRDSIESDEQINFNMRYFSTTHAMVLNANTPKDNKDWCANKDATHVVMSLMYGMGANFVFKRMAALTDSKEEIMGDLKVAVKSIPGMAIEGSAHLNITGKQKKFRESIGVTLYGDFILEEQPTTYNQSIQVFKTIPQKMGKAPDYKMAAPMKMKLMPKRFLCSEGDNILLGISKQLLDTVSTILDNADQLKIKLRGLIAKDPSARFLPVRRNLQDIEQRLSSEISGLQAKLQTILPQIRAGDPKSQEGDLIGLLDAYNLSPLQYDTCANFLSHRTREIVAIDTLLTSFTQNNNILVVDYEEATGVIEILVTPYVVICNLNILQPHSVTTDFLAGKTTDESDMWFNDVIETGMMGQQLRQFIDFALENGNSKDYSYLVKINPVQSKTLAIDAMENGRTISSDFTLPNVPYGKVRPQATSTTHATVTFRLPDHDNNQFVTGVLVIGWKAAEPNVKFQKTFEYAGNRDGMAVMEGLTSGVSYRFQMKFITEVGLSPPSPTTDVITTLPSSPPSNYEVTRLTRDSVTVAWQPPLEIGGNMTVTRYDVQISANGNPVQQQTVSNKMVTFGRLTRATTYQLCVKAVLTGMGGGQHNVHRSNCLSFLITTLPSPPNTPTVSAIGYNSATITWTRGTIAPGATLLHYLVYFSHYDASGRQEVLGTAIERRADATNTRLRLGDLILGTTYGVKVKMVTSKGDSSYSSLKIFKTLYKQTDLDKFKSQIITQMRKEYKAEFAKATQQQVSQIKKDDAAAMKSLTDLSKKYDGLKSGWPTGSYCIFQGNSGACPSGFTEFSGYMKGIATTLIPNQTPKTAGIIKGFNYGMSSMGCYKWFCGHYAPYNGEILMYACCK